MKIRSALIIFAALAFPSLAWAHPEGAQTHSLLTGLSHPISGLDHLVAAAAVGMWGGALGGRARWLLPVAFVSAMGIGIFFGAGMASNVGELAIAISVIGLGLFLALDTRPDTRIAASLAACAGLAHGGAHAAEADPALPAFAAGALIMTVLLHASGVLLAVTARNGLTLPFRIAGAATAVFGVALVSGVLSV